MVRNPGAEGPKRNKAEVPPPPPVRPRYIAALLGSAVAALGMFYVGLGALSATGHLPPPAFSNSLCVDEKLAFHREHPEARPNLLVIGSSVAWRHFDGARLVHDLPQVKPLNGAFCGLAANQSVYAANWFLDQTPGIRDVLMITSPQDFENCSTNRAAIFDGDDAAKYVSGEASPWRYYMRYFDPISLARNAGSIAAQRSGQDFVDPLVFDPYGSGPLDTTRNRDTLLYGMVKSLDRKCFDAVAALARRLKAEDRRLLVATTPLHPDWKADGSAAPLLAEFNGRMREALAEDPQARFWDGDAARVVERGAFFDAIHLRWSAAGTYTAALGQALHPVAAEPRLQATIR
ncbi:hypothetical protein ACFOD4_09750 [Pseudoroseomonas globiformis]|uniref:SGNH/GDSL hydrolase family protein n=1 Tax=Teichococcus globiformis TaxID=2307229 RepID=A0ABV7G1D8_9PROT